MPPRYAYWTILIDQKPTAFRAHEREDLLPTLHQLKRRNADVVLKWFANGRLWSSPEEAREARRAPKRPKEARGRDWRPGGDHRDPRDRFKKRPRSAGAAGGARGDRGKPAGKGRQGGWRASGNQRRDQQQHRRPPQSHRREPQRREPRRETEVPPNRRDESPDKPPAAEQIVTKPKPPERG
jgi:hypothetical protein